ncbi:MAG TPA: glycosyltransferase [Acidimicrobiales bacterium]|nr:glycosyltransferase [Acidimicrobiales bacterium]
MTITAPVVAPVVALVAAKDAEADIAATVAALVALGEVDEVVVVDDGSTDATAAAAVGAGARVVRLPSNRGKGGALVAGIAAAPDAEVYLLVDADVAGTAALAGALLPPVLGGTADLTIGVLPPAAGRGGFGKVRDLAARGIRRAVGFETRAPLSGQRAVRGELLRSLELADRFGVETAMTIDAIRAGARVVEIDVAMDHRHTGRTVAGFRHRARQGTDVARALWPRLTTSSQRIAVMMVAFAVLAAVVLVTSARAAPASAAATGPAPDRVLVVGMPGLSLDDLGSGRTPVIDRLIHRGAVAAMSVRTLAGRPSVTEGYATLGAGSRVRADATGALAYDAADVVEGGTAVEAMARRTGVRPSGAVVVLGAPTVQRLSSGKNVPSLPGALGDALHLAGKRAAVVGNGDGAEVLTAPGSTVRRPAAVAVMRSDGSVDGGSVSPALLRPDRRAPFGRRADAGGVVAATRQALVTAEVVVVDPGDLSRAADFALVATPDAADGARRRAVRQTDALLGRLVDAAGPRTLVLVVAVTPPNRTWHLTPIIAAGPGVTPGWLHSASTRRAGVVTLTDVAPTVLDALGVTVPDAMIGNPLRYRAGTPELDQLRRLDRDAAYREGIYLPLTIWYIVLQAMVYLFALLAFGRFGGAGSTATLFRWVVLAIAAHPLASFVLRAIPNVAALGGLGVVLLVAIDIAIAGLAQRARRHALSPLAWILGLTVALLCADVATGARLQTSSLLGYSLHTAARFTGLGNTAFATLAATTVLAGALHVHFAPRRREALVAVALLFSFVVLVDGAPSLGSDVGGILTLVPVFGLTLLVLAGRRVSWRALVVAGAVTVLAVGLATGIDLLRPPEARTHLGRLVADVGHDGLSPFWATLGRKVSANFRTYRSPWSWAVVVITVYLLAILVWARGWARLLPPGSALRAGTVGALAAGLLGYLTNDSGIVVTALVFVYLGPFLTLVALEDERGGAVVPEAPLLETGP